MIYARRTRDAISITNTGIRKVSFSFTKHGQIRVEWSFEATDRLEIVIDADCLLEVVPTRSPEMTKS